jgi:hypothetical protein
MNYVYMYKGKFLSLSVLKNKIFKKYIMNVPLIKIKKQNQKPSFKINLNKELFNKEAR